MIIIFFFKPLLHLVNNFSFSPNAEDYMYGIYALLYIDLIGATIWWPLGWLRNLKVIAGPGLL